MSPASWAPLSGPRGRGGLQPRRREGQQHLDPGSLQIGRIVHRQGAGPTTWRRTGSGTISATTPTSGSFVSITPLGHHPVASRNRAPDCGGLEGETAGLTYPSQSLSVSRYRCLRSLTLFPSLCRRLNLAALLACAGLGTAFAETTLVPDSPFAPAGTPAGAAAAAAESYQLAGSWMRLILRRRPRPRPARSLPPPLRRPFPPRTRSLRPTRGRPFPPRTRSSRPTRPRQAAPPTYWSRHRRSAAPLRDRRTRMRRRRR